MRLDATHHGVGSGRDRLAIRPYPKALEETFTLPDGQRIFVRPLRPDDAQGLQSGIRRLDPEDVRMRFLSHMREMSPTMAARPPPTTSNPEMDHVPSPAEGRGSPAHALAATRPTHPNQ